MTAHLPKKLEHIATEDLLPYARNSRTHSPAQIDAVARSITAYGFTNPVLIRGQTIIAGHGRVMAAKQIGLEKVPAIRLDHLSESEARAYVIADNRLAELAGWDDAVLADELRLLKQDGLDLALTGWEGKELDELMFEPTVPKTDPDATPPVQEVARSQRGDVWTLGGHRIMCGDSTSALDVEMLLDGGGPHLMVTDPPYGVEYDPTRTSDNPLKSGKVLNDDRADWREAWALFPGDVAYVWHASMFTHTVLESLESCGFEHRAMIIWGKERFTLGRGHYHWQHEPAWYVVKKGATGHWQGDRSQATLWNINAREDSGHGHGTQKPIECMRRPIENNSAIGDSVYEPFSGSGTTIIAAEQTGRRCYAMELSPNYVDVAVRRWQNFTGQRAIHAVTGEPFGD